MTARLRYRRMDTRAIHPADRFDYWRTMVAPLKLEPAGPIPRDFRVSAESLSDGDVGLIEMDRGPATARWGREVGLAQGRLRLVMLGPAAGAAARWYGHDVPLTRGGAALLGATDGWWRVPSRMRGIEVDLPRAAVPVSDAELARLNAGRQLATDPVYTALVRPALAGMAGHLGQLGLANRLDGLAAVWTSLITMLVASVSGTGAGEAELAPARRMQARNFIAGHLADPGLGPDTVAAALHISRRSLYAALNADDAGITAQIRTARLAAARAILADPADRRPIADIAARVGLTSPAHFSRLFRRQYGQSPRELRAATSATRRSHQR